MFRAPESYLQSASPLSPWGHVTTKEAKLPDLLSDFEDVAQIVEHAKTVRKVSLFQECIKLASVMQFLEKHMEFRCKGIAPVPQGGVGEVEMIGVSGVVKKPKPITQFYGRMVVLCCSGHQVGFAYSRNFPLLQKP